MYYFLTLFLIFLSFVVKANEKLDRTYLFCEKTPEYFFKEKEKQSENYIFFILENNVYEVKKIIKNNFNKNIDFTFIIFNSGKYSFNEKNINFVDNLKFRTRRLKSELDRNTMILTSKYKTKLYNQYVCENTDLRFFNSKSLEIITKAKKFWKNKTKDNKI